jgi:hypothetical protein
MEQFQLPNADDTVHEAILRRKQQPGDGVAVYAEDMLKLFRQLLVPPSEKEKVRLIYRNLVRELRILLSRNSFSTVRAMIGEARRAEAAAEEEDVKAQPQGASSLKLDLGKKEPVRTTAQPQPPRKADRVCFICGEADHFARACPQRRRPSDERPSQGNGLGAPPGQKEGSR